MMRPMTNIVVPDPLLADDVVLLRPWEPDDVEQILAACQDAAIQRFIPIPRPYGRADAEGYVARTQRQWGEGSKAAFAIVERDDPDHLLGAINVAVFGAVGNSAYWVAPDARGRGIAPRALRLLTGWALGPVGLGVLLLEVHPDNAASLHVAREAGFTDAGQIEVADPAGGRVHRILVLLASDRSARSGT
jgi:RimJ/RimL family protein N-acetyltransferase